MKVSNKYGNRMDESAIVGKNSLTTVQIAFCFAACDFRFSCCYAIFSQILLSSINKRCTVKLLPMQKAEPHASIVCIIHRVRYGYIQWSISFCEESGTHPYLGYIFQVQKLSIEKTSSKNALSSCLQQDSHTQDQQ